MVKSILFSIALVASVAFALVVCNTEAPECEQTDGLISKLIEQAERIRTRGSITFDEVFAAYEATEKADISWRTQKRRTNFAFRLLDEFAFDPIRDGKINNQSDQSSKETFVEQLVDDFIIGWET